jgi:hypothetical protein
MSERFSVAVMVAPSCGAGVVPVWGFTTMTATERPVGPLGPAEELFTLMSSRRISSRRRPGIPIAEPNRLLLWQLDTIGLIVSFSILAASIVAAPESGCSAFIRGMEPA